MPTHGQLGDTMKNIFSILAILALSLMIIGANGCGQTTETTTDTSETAKETTHAEDWKNIELTDVLTGDTFKISDLEGKPILLESFAVWCPTCRKQQDKVKELHEEIGDSIVSISIDVDPNEDAQQVIDHANRNEFDWIFTISPTSLTQSLIDEFGVSIINAPSAPIILICPDQSQARLLKRGVKSSAELKEAIATC